MDPIKNDQHRTVYLAVVSKHTRLLRQDMLPRSRRMISRRRPWDSLGVTSRRVVRLMSRTPKRSSSRVTSFETAEGDKPMSAAAPAKLPRSITRWKMPIFVRSLSLLLPRSRYPRWVMNVVSCTRRGLPLYPRLRTFSASQRTVETGQTHTFNRFRLFDRCECWHGTTPRSRG
jgi:hypothetical protein